MFWMSTDFKITQILFVMAVFGIQTNSSSPLQLKDTRKTGKARVSSLARQTRIRENCHSFSVSDPQWHNYWYLNATAVGITDMNILHAWRRCYNGTGVIVAVVDDGISDHPDLNVDRTLSADVDLRIPATKTHGTEVAGIIAAKNNNICGIGIAFGATLVDIRLLTGTSISDKDRASMLISSIDKIDIYSNSYNAKYDGISIHNLGQSVIEALEYGTSKGRNGKGVVYVWSTGNGGDPYYPHGCAYDGYDNNPYIIPIAGVQWNYTKLPTGDSCSSIMVAAFSRDPYDKVHQIVTTRGQTGCVGNFGRNSAAVPMVSGAIALALQANPSLSYRDIMHLLTKSSNNSLPFQPNDFITNAAGYHVSKTFGFGLLNIGALVDMAVGWKNVPRLKSCTFVSNLTCSLLSNRTFALSKDNCSINFIEHVEVYFKVKYHRAGKLSLQLLSPRGTQSNIIPGRGLDGRQELTLTVISVHFWGESPSGRWYLTTGDIANDIFGLINGTMLELRLKFYGMEHNTFPTTDSTTSEEPATKESTYSKHLTTSKHSTSTTEQVISSTHIESASPNSTLETSSFTQKLHTTEENCIDNVPPRDIAAEVGLPIGIIIGIVIVVAVIIIAVMVYRRKSILIAAQKSSSCLQTTRVDIDKEESDISSTRTQV